MPPPSSEPSLGGSRKQGVDYRPRGAGDILEPMDIDPALGLPLFSPPLDTEALASWFDSGYPLEFCASESFDPSFIRELSFSGFIPMACRDEEGGREILTPKLHRERAILDPKLVRITRTAGRDSRRFVLCVDSALPEVLERCSATHGEAWLRPPLREGILALAGHGAEGSLGRILSFELRDEDRLVAGEFGFLVGAAYTSFSGFRSESGTGTVQLAATARALETAGVLLWDLGMPMGYKEALGARTVDRGQFLALFRAARSAPLSPDFSFLPEKARSLLTRQL